jgi:hypothetical protein
VSIEAKSGCVVAGQTDKALGQSRAIAAGPRQIARGVLHAHDVRNGSKPRHGLHRNLDDAAAWDIVQDNRDVDGLAMAAKCR